MLPDSTVAVLPLSRLTRLYDGLEQLEDMWGDDVSQSEDSYRDEEQEEFWEDEQGVWLPNVSGDGDTDDWVDDEEDAMDVDEESWADPAMEVSTPEPGSAPPLPSDGANTPEPPTLRPTSPDVPKDAVEDDSDKNAQAAEEPNWKRFEILASAPVDHAFYNSAPAQPSRSFHARLNKEYRVLSTSLPGTWLSVCQCLRLTYPCGARQKQSWFERTKIARICYAV